MSDTCNGNRLGACHDGATSVSKDTDLSGGDQRFELVLDLSTFMTGTPAGLQFTLSTQPGERTDLSAFSELNPGDTLLFNAFLDISNAGSFASQ